MKKILYIIIGFMLAYGISVQATPYSFMGHPGNMYYDDAMILFGIGTSTPHWLLQLATSTAPQITLSDGIAADSHWSLRNAGGFFYIATSSPSTFATSTATAYTIDSNGKHGIGTTTPATLFHVSNGPNATTTVEFDARDTTSKSCINMRTNTGGAVSLYVVGTTLKIEANACR